MSSVADRYFEVYTATGSRYYRVNVDHSDGFQVDLLTFRGEWELSTDHHTADDFLSADERSRREITLGEVPTRD